MSLVNDCVTHTVGYRDNMHSYEQVSEDLSCLGEEEAQPAPRSRRQGGEGDAGEHAHPGDHQIPAPEERPTPMQAWPNQNRSEELKSESFRQKEKRKRDLGMANREKSYVEEEKRILRQSFGDT
ncbi:hypothetical protein Bbelb_307200 [Branchiostoma belcheri]|nr:hypothetical protein Bbelb_307200 [Branchiostoma belcheri]